MVQVHLRKILNREVRTVIESLVATSGGNVLIQDEQGSPLMGSSSEGPDRYPITVAGSVMGWVIGGPQVAPVATFLSVLAAKEQEKKSLAQKVLNSYREMKLVCKIAEKLTHCSDVSAVAQLTIQEAHRFYQESTVSLLLLDRQNSQLHPLATLGGHSCPIVPIGQGIIGSIALSGQGEIVNDVRSDIRLAPTDLPAQSLVCVPVTYQEQVTAVLRVSQEKPHGFSLESLMVLEAIATQTAPALERTRHRFKFRNNDRLPCQTHPSTTISIEVDESTRRDQMAQITESDFFKQLEATAEELRSSMNQ